MCFQSIVPISDDTVLTYNYDKVKVLFEIVHFPTSPVLHILEALLIAGYGEAECFYLQ